MKVMIVDDNASTSDLLQYMLSKISFESCKARDGCEAILKYLEEQPDLVLMDLRMPVMDGITTTRRLLHEYPSAKIVIVTGYDSGFYRDAAKDAGALEYIVKDHLTQLPEVLASYVTIH